MKLLLYFQNYPHIPETTIALNKINIEIVNILGNMLDFDPIRVENVKKIPTKIPL